MFIFLLRKRSRSCHFCSNRLKPICFQTPVDMSTHCFHIVLGDVAVQNCTWCAPGEDPGPLTIRIHHSPSRDRLDSGWFLFGTFLGFPKIVLEPSRDPIRKLPGRSICFRGTVAAWLRVHPRPLPPHLEAVSGPPQDSTGIICSRPGPPKTTSRVLLGSDAAGPRQCQIHCGPS